MADQQVGDGVVGQVDLDIAIEFPDPQANLSVFGGAKRDALAERIAHHPFDEIGQRVGLAPIDALPERLIQLNRVRQQDLQFRVLAGHGLGSDLQNQPVQKVVVLQRVGDEPAEPVAHVAVDLALQIADGIAAGEPQGFFAGRFLLFGFLPRLLEQRLGLAARGIDNLVGLLAGIVSFVPFVGSLTGFLVAMLLAVSQFWPEWLPIAQVALVFVVGQAIEGNVLSPKIVGGRVKLHPVWLIFSLFVFGYLFGFVGVLVAVPLGAAIAVLVRFTVTVYLDSEIYRGSGDAEARDDMPS